MTEVLPPAQWKPDSWPDRQDCGICGSGKHAAQYEAVVITHDGNTMRYDRRPGVCWLCPRCDVSDESSTG